MRERNLIAHHFFFFIRLQSCGRSGLHAQAAERNKAAHLGSFFPKRFIGPVVEFQFINVNRGVRKNSSPANRQTPRMIWMYMSCPVSWTEMRSAAPAVARMTASRNQPALAEPRVI